MRKNGKRKHSQISGICLILAGLMIYAVSGCGGTGSSQEIKPTAATSLAGAEEAAAPVIVPPSVSAGRETAAPETAQTEARTASLPETEGKTSAEDSGKEKKANRIIDPTQFHPTVSITSEKPVDSKEDYVDCTLTVEGTDEEYVFQDVPAEIRIRGNSSAENTDTPPYKIKFGEKNSFLGLHDGKTFKTWVLLNESDGICANYLIYKMGKVLFGDNYFVTDAALTKVVLNGRDMGLYTACEQTQIKKNRVNVTEAVTGSESGDRIGYLIELDNYARPGDTMFVMNNQDLTVRDYEGNEIQALYKEYTLKNDEISDRQLEFISKYMNNVYRLIHAASYEGKAYRFDTRYDLTAAQITPEQAIRNVIDIDAAVDMYLLEEITANMDKGNGSFYFAVDFADDAVYPKLTFMPPWDLGWCNFNAEEGCYAAVINQNKEENESDNEWLIMLMYNDWFREEVAARAKQLAQSAEMDGVFAKTRAYMESYYPEIRPELKEEAEKRMAFYEKRYRWVLSSFAE